MRKVSEGYRFGEYTIIPPHETINDIRQELERFDARDFLEFTSQDRGVSVIAFKVDAGTFLVYIPLPDPALKGKPVSRPEGASTAKLTSIFKDRWGQERARLLRVVFHLIKAKLVAAQEGVTTLEKEFFADLVIWNGQGRQQTAYEWYAPQVAHLKAAGLQPPVLPAIENPRLLSAWKGGEEE